MWECEPTFELDANFLSKSFFKNFLWRNDRNNNIITIIFSKKVLKKKHFWLEKKSLKNPKIQKKVFLLN